MGDVPVSTFEPGDVVCLRSGPSVKMTVIDSWGPQENLTYVVAWLGVSGAMERGPLPGAAMKLVESAKPAERLPVYEKIRLMCRGHVDGSLAIQKTLAFTILEMLKEHGL
jgi:hypothetical protein